MSKLNACTLWSLKFVNQKLLNIVGVSLLFFASACELTAVKLNDDIGAEPSNSDKISTKTGGSLDQVLPETKEPESAPIENKAPVNRPPQAKNLSIKTDEDSSVALELVGSDVDQDALTFSIEIEPDHGKLSGTLPNLSYIPEKNFNGSDYFVYKVNDGKADSALAKVMINVKSVNDLPSVTGQTFTMMEDSFKNFILSGIDEDKDDLVFSIVEAPKNGVIEGTAPQFKYIPNANYAGTDSIKFKANDGKADSAIGTVVFLMTAVNDAPLAIGQNLESQEDTAKEIILAGSDIENSPLTFSLIEMPTKGVLSGTPPNLSYLPNSNYNGSDSFTFKVSDGSLESEAATVSLKIVAVNDAPLAVAQNLETNEDTAKTITLTGSDVEESSLSFSIVNMPTNGVLSGTPPNLSYLPNSNYNGSDSFTFKVSDGSLESEAATVSLKIVAVNDAPTAIAQNIAVVEDSELPIILSGKDIENDSLNFKIKQNPGNGILSGSGANYVYKPNSGFVGSDVIFFYVNDGVEDSASVAVNIAITAKPRYILVQGPSVVYQNICSTLNVTLQNENHETLVENLENTFVLSANSGAFFDSSCTNVKTSFSVPAGKSHVKLYYKNANVISKATSIVSHSSKKFLPSTIELEVKAPGTSGTQESSINLSGFTVNEMQSLPDGKIIVVGKFSNNFGVARLNSDATLDSTFGNAGIVNTPIGLAVDVATSLAIQPDGKIVVGGFYDNGATTNRDDMALVRYMPDGSLDTTFGVSSGVGTGIVTQRLSEFWDRIHGVALQSDGKIVAAGCIRCDNSDNVAVLRFLANGTLDQSFDGNSGNANGIITMAIDGNKGKAKKVFVRDDSKILIGGDFSNPMFSDFLLMQMDSVGRLDTSFGVGGIRKQAILDADNIYGMTLQRDGKIVLVGSCASLGAPNKMCFARFSSNASLEATKTATFGTSHAWGRAVNSLPSGKLLIGTEFFAADLSVAKIVIRYNADLSVDTSFGSGGVQALPSTSSIGTSLLQDDGKIIFSGGSNLLRIWQ